MSDSDQFPPRAPGGDPDEEPVRSGRPLAATIALASGIACALALVVVEMNDTAVARLVSTASLALSIVSAGIALLSGENREPRARRMALAGAGIAVVASILSATVDLHHDSPATRAANGTVTKAGSVPFTQVRVGDCFGSQPPSDATALHAVPCTSAHHGEVVAEVDLSDQVGAEVDASFRVARQRCQDELRTAVRTSDPAVASASLLVIPAPRSAGLDALCAVVTRAERTGSVRS